MRTGVIHKWAIVLGCALLAGQVLAQEDSAADAAANANNPLANMKAFNLQNYYIGELTGSEESGNQFGFVTHSPSQSRIPTGYYVPRCRSIPSQRHRTVTGRQGWAT